MLVAVSAAAAGEVDGRLECWWRICGERHLSEASGRDADANHRFRVNLGQSLAVFDDRAKIVGACVACIFKAAASGATSAGVAIALATRAAVSAPRDNDSKIAAAGEPHRLPKLRPGRHAGALFFLIGGAVGEYHQRMASRTVGVDFERVESVREGLRRGNEQLFLDVMDDDGVCGCRLLRLGFGVSRVLRLATETRTSEDTSARNHQAANRGARIACSTADSWMCGQEPLRSKISSNSVVPRRVPRLRVVCERGRMRTCTTEIERRRDVGKQVVNRLATRAEPDESWFNGIASPSPAALGASGDAAEAGGVGDQRSFRQKAFGVLAAFEGEADDRAEVSHLLQSESVAGMGG